jgi:hypothetical protein
MKINEFEQEIKKIDEGFSVTQNPNPGREGLSNIFFRGRNYDLPVISSYEIKDEPDPSYMYEFPNGVRARLWSKSEVIPRLEQFIKDFNDNKFDGLY